MQSRLLTSSFLFSFLLLPSSILGILLNEENISVYTNKPIIKMSVASLETQQSSIFPLAKIIDDFDGITETVFTWWDGDGTEVYQRSLDFEFKRSGINSMKVNYIKRSEKYKFSFFAFQPKQDGVNNNFSKYEKLSFWLHTKSPLELIVKLQDKKKKAFEQKFVLPAKDEWQHIEFDFSQTWGVNLSQIDNVLFFAQPGEYKVKGTFWIEDIYLVKTKSTPQEPPQIPQNLEYKEEDGILKFSWSDELKSGAAVYEVWLAKDLEFSQPIIFWTNHNFLEFWEAPPEWSYFKVRAWNQLPEYGGKSSSFSETWSKE